MLDKIMMRRNSAIVQLRAEGHSLAYIGNVFGITRERVRQLIKENSPHLQSVPSTLLTAPQVARQLGITLPTLYSLVRRRGIKPTLWEHVSGRMLWDAEAIRRLELALPKCRICGAPVPSYRFRYCSEECCLEAKKYRNWPKEVQERQVARVKRWAMEHPDKHREISRRACKTWYRRRMSGRQYLVVKRNNSIPIGAVVIYAGSARPGWITVAKSDGLCSIPQACLRIIKPQCQNRN